MKLYHGSKNKLDTVERRQAGNPKNLDVPEKELLNAIYLTPNYGFALACAARPNGLTRMDSKNMTIEFGSPELFDPEEDVYVYEFDIENIPKEKVIYVDDLQYAVDADELRVSNKFSHKAKDVQEYYEIKELKENPEEIRQEFKMR
ncbi:MAG: hypothetical protein ACD_9C00322G0003 [uncultured bacterium]|nr:MAG: hypothetical protein ACD_9C00322G0003 [uncultured bacterium]